MDGPPPLIGKDESPKRKIGDTGKPPGKKKEKPQTRALKAKKKDKREKSLESAVHSQIFSLHEISNNKEASALITDLVKCYTSNSTLPQEELSLLNKTLYEKTVSLFLHILNNCVDKIFNKLLSSDVFKQRLLNKTVIQKNAMCQTDITYSDY